MIQDHGGWLWLLVDVGLVVLLGVALAYGMTHWRRSRGPKAAGERATRELYQADAVPTPRDPSARPSKDTDPASRPTEDDLAQAALGGTRGSPELAPAPMTPQREKKTPKSLEPGHTS